MNNAFPFPIGTVHIIGIGGIGMSGYAEVLHNMGYAVQGSDQTDNANAMRLCDLGVRVIIGHNPQNVLDREGKACSVVVRSTAIKDDNPEVVSALAQGVPVIPRVDLLVELMRSKWCINISGTHGKTTTTSMVGHVLDKAGLDPTVINGGIINAYGSNTRIGASQWMVVESDESDGTFAKLPSVISVVTNIDPEHLDFYGSFDNLKKAFVSYIENLPFYGVAVVCVDHPVVKELLPQFKRHVVTYGFDEDADVRAVNVRPAPEGLVCDITFKPELKNYPVDVKDVVLPFYGQHNVLNAMAAVAVAHDIGIKIEDVVAGLAKFSGVKRRFTTTGVVNDITIIDDYAHHPVEMVSVLKAAQEAVLGRGKGRVLAVVQPHRYTRLQSLFADFCESCGEAAAVVVTDVYAAGETPIEGFNKDTLVAGMKKSGQDNVYAVDSVEELPDLIYKIAKPGDFVICMGAGDITQWAHGLPIALERLYDETPQIASNGA